MSPNNNKGSKSLLKTLLSPNLGCGCTNRRPNHPDFYHPKPIPKPKPKPKPTSSTSSHSSAMTYTTLSPSAHSSSSEPNTKPKGKEIDVGPTPSPSPSPSPSPNCCSSTTSSKVEESIAVVKETKDPYNDFRHSILQMIFEKEIFSPDDLHHLLHCFLRLNSPAHHDVILRAFVDACNAVVSASPPPPAA